MGIWCHRSYGLMCAMLLFQLSALFPAAGFALKYPHTFIRRHRQLPNKLTWLPPLVSKHPGDSFIASLVVTAVQSPDFLSSLEEPTPSNKFTPAVDMTSDAGQLYMLLRNVSVHMETSSVDSVVGMISQRLDWLLARNVPQLALELLGSFTEIREDEGIMRAYLFLIDVLEQLVQHSNALNMNCVDALQGLLAAANGTEASLDAYIAQNSDYLLHPNFQVFLDSQIERYSTSAVASTSNEKNGSDDVTKSNHGVGDRSRATSGNNPDSSDNGSIYKRDLLHIVKLRLLKESAKRVNEHVLVLGELVQEEDDSVLQAKVKNYLSSPSRPLSTQYKEDFLQQIQQRLNELQSINLSESSDAWHVAGRLRLIQAFAAKEVGHVER